MQRTPRIHCEDLGKSKEITLQKEEIRHLRVLRIAKGERIILFDGKGNEATAEVISIGPSEGKVRVLEVKKGLAPQVRIDLATAAPKGERLDWLAEKAAEVGISSLFIIKSERSEVAPSSAKLARLQRIAQEAAAQSGRSTIMRVSEAAADLPRIFDYGKQYGLRLLADPAGAPLQEMLQKVSPGIVPNGIMCLIGPEGGFSETEKEAARAAGFAPVRLNPAILRVETAAVVMAAQLTAAFEP